MWIHILTELDKINKTAICKNCGPTNVYVGKTPAGKIQYACSEGAKARVKRRKSWLSRTPEQRRHWRKGRRFSKKVVDVFNLHEPYCPICKTPFTYIKEHRATNRMLDHCHKTGIYRGYLCGYCNSLLGYAKDSIETLQGAIEYLKRFC